MNNSKPWYTSWTIWFNVIFALGTFIDTIAPIVPFPSWFLVGAAAVSNILLRFKTNTSLLPADPVSSNQG